MLYENPKYVCLFALYLFQFISNLLYVVVYKAKLNKNCIILLTVLKALSKVNKLC